MSTYKSISLYKDNKISSNNLVTCLQILENISLKSFTSNDSTSDHVNKIILSIDKDNEQKKKESKL